MLNICGACKSNSGFMEKCDPNYPTILTLNFALFSPQISFLPLSLLTLPFDPHTIPLFFVHLQQLIQMVPDSLTIVFREFIFISRRRVIVPLHKINEWIYCCPSVNWMRKLHCVKLIIVALIISQDNWVQPIQSFYLLGKPFFTTLPPTSHRSVKCKLQIDQ